jgi:hypothetical protein
MAERKKGRERKVESQIARSVGFVANYKGKDIAFAREFDTLINKPMVKERMGEKDLVIKHNVPEGVIAVY